MTAAGTAQDGGSIYDTHDSLVTGIVQSAEQLGQSVIGSSASQGLSELVQFAEDPMGAVMQAGLSFLEQAIQVVLEPLQHLMDDPGSAQGSAQQLQQHADTMRQMAQDHSQDAEQLGSDWQGAAADGYRQVAGRTSGQLASMGRVLEGAGSLTTSASGLVSGLRSMVIKVITEMVQNLMPGGVSALAAAPETFGASIAMFVAEALGVAAKVAAEIASKISSLKSALSQIDGYFGQLGQALEQLSADVFGPAGGSAGAGSPAPAGGG